MSDFRRLEGMFVLGVSILLAIVCGFIVYIAVYPILMP